MPAMPDQFTLPGFDDPPAPMPRPAKPTRKADFNLFLALLPEDDDALRIHAGAEALCRQHALSKKPTAADRLHVSLFGLAAYWEPLPKQEMEALCARVDAAMAPLRHPSLPLVFNRLMSFGRPDGIKRLPWVQRPDDASERALKDLHRSVQLTLSLHGIVEAGGGFTPHMTLLYDPLHLAEQAIEPLAWTARKLVLILSHVGRSKYERLRCWGLGPST